MEEPNITVHIRTYRQAAGESLVECGAKIKRSKSYVARFECKQGPLTVEELDILSKEYGIPPWELVVFHDWPLPPCAQTLTVPGRPGAADAPGTP